MCLITITNHGTVPYERVMEFYTEMAKSDHILYVHKNNVLKKYFDVKNHEVATMFLLKYYFLRTASYDEVDTSKTKVLKNV